MAKEDQTQALKARIAELEQELQRASIGRDSRLRYALEASRDGLWDWDIASGTIYFSRSYLRLLGYNFDHLPGTFDTLCDYFVHPGDRDMLVMELRAAIDNCRQRIELEHRMLHRDGYPLWVHTHGLLVEPDENGKARRCVGTLTDISRTVHDQQSLIAAKAEAEMASNAKSKFLASMSHEIRTPMNAIIGLGHLLGDTELNDVQKSYLSSMSVAASSLLQVLNQVFDYAKLEAGNIILENSHFDLEQLFERLSRMFETNALHRPVNIIFDIDDLVPRFLRGDATRLSHVISHLVTNALQYSASDEVLVKAECVKREGDAITLRFSISDFGEGLSSAKLDQLRRALSDHPDSEQRDKTQGFGLQICKLLVRLMNGTLHIVSNQGKGTTLSFTADFEKSQIGTRTIQRTALACQAMRLLIVDDNKLAREILAKSAIKLVHNIDTATDAHIALKKIHDAERQNNPYDLVLLDYKMPLKNGLEAAREIKTSTEINHKPTIFLVSSFHRDEIFSDHHDSNYVDDFLSKPVSESRLFDAICRAFPEVAIAEPAPESLDFEQLRGLCVLLVEDNPVNQTVAAGIMQKKGIVVVSVDNGKEALDLLLTTPDQFDVILMDVEMPVMDGLTATREIRNHIQFKRLPIIAVTAQAMPGDREICLEVGMNDYISKPINPTALYQLLSDLIDRQKKTTSI